MSCNYIQNEIALLGTSAAPITLTNAYSDAEPANSAKASITLKNDVTLLVHYTMGAAETGNSIQVKVETADSYLAIDSALWARRTREAVSSGAVTLSAEEFTFTATKAAGTYDVFEIRLPELNANYIKVSVKETGIATNGGSCYIKAITLGR